MRQSRAAPIPDTRQRTATKERATASSTEAAPLCDAEPRLLNHEPRDLRIQRQLLHVQGRGLHPMPKPVDVIRVGQIDAYESGSEFTVVFFVYSKCTMSSAGPKTSSRNMRSMPGC